jgi:hypothetical protein
MALVVAARRPARRASPPSLRRVAPARAPPGRRACSLARAFPGRRRTRASRFRRPLARRTGCSRARKYPARTGPTTRARRTRRHTVRPRIARTLAAPARRALRCSPRAIDDRRGCGPHGADHAAARSGLHLGARRARGARGDSRADATRLGRMRQARTRASRRRVAGAASALVVGAAAVRARPDVGGA